MSSQASLPELSPLPLAPGLYPARCWPANILRLHLVFPRAMDCWAAAGMVVMRDAAGQELTGVFVDIEHGLWSGCGRILTIMFHPGRIKTGLEAHERLGLALTPGARVQLCLSNDLKDASGAHHGLPERYEIQVGRPMTRSLVTSFVRRGAMRVDLAASAPIDAVGALRHIRLIDRAGTPIAAQLRQSASGFAFLHRTSQQVHRIEVDGALEDCCGNRREHPFETRFGGKNEG